MVSQSCSNWMHVILIRTIHTHLRNIYPSLSLSLSFPFSGSLASKQVTLNSRMNYEMKEPKRARERERLEINKTHAQPVSLHQQNNKKNEIINIKTSHTFTHIKQSIHPSHKKGIEIRTISNERKKI